MLKQQQGAAVLAAMAALSPDAPRVPLPGGFEDDLLRAAIMLTAALSCDGVPFVIRMAPGRAPLGEDAEAEIGQGGASISIARIPSTLLQADPADRLVTLMAIGAHAYRQARERLEGEIAWDREEPFDVALCHHAVAQPQAVIDAARKRLCH